MIYVFGRFYDDMFSKALFSYDYFIVRIPAILERLQNAENPGNYYA